MDGAAKDLTELVEIDPERVDLVRSPANGFPVLLMKAVNPQGGIDEKPDIAGAESVMQQLARLIQAEAAELAVGQWDEVCDIELLLQATHLMGCFRAREMYGDVDDGEPYVAKSADFPSQDELESAVTYLAKRKVSAAERKQLAAAGHALPDGSYPISNEEDLHNAAVLARSGHGDVAAAKRLIAKRAKELGVANPLATDTQKDTEVVDETTTTETPEATEPQADEPVEKSLDELVQEAVAKAMKDRDEAVEGLRTELAVLKDTPIPGGPAITAPPQRPESQRLQALGEASRYERLAKSVTDADQRRYYEQKAQEAREAANG